MNSSTEPIPPMRSVQVDVFRSPTVILKIVEVVICFIVIGCFFAYIGGWGYFVASTVIGALFHSASLLTCYCFQQTQIQKTYLEMMLNAWFAFALFICSILCMSSWGSVVAAGVFSLFLAPVYGLDTYFAYQNFMARPLLGADQVDSGSQPPNSGVTSYPPPYAPPQTAQPNPYSLSSPYNPSLTLSYQNDPPPHLQQNFGVPSTFGQSGFNKPGQPGV